MAHVKNSNRSKRKYGDGQKQRTARNKTLRKARHDRRLSIFAEKAADLLGKRVTAAGQSYIVSDVTPDTVPRQFILTLPDGQTIRRTRKRIKL